MPWETPLQSIAASISGPVAKGVGVVGIVFSGLLIAEGRGDSGTHSFFIKRTWILRIVCGLSIAFTATSFFLGFFGYSE